MKWRHETSEAQPGMARIVDRNIRALLEERKEAERRSSLGERIAQRITEFTGSMTFVLLHAIFVLGWVLVNLPWFPGPKFDPSFVILAMIASVEALFLSTFILITQNRMMKLADRRADLNLQINLLSEHEVTRLIKMTAQICDRLGISDAKTPDLAELSQDVRPEKVLEKLVQHEEQSTKKP
jgi:uncharacterized membrane protein